MIENEVKTREEYKKLKQEERDRAEAERKERKTAVSRPIWLRLVIFLALCIVCLSAGAAVGYSAFGNGKVLDVFKPSTWTHIYDLVNKK